MRKYLSLSKPNHWKEKIHNFPLVHCLNIALVKICTGKVGRLLWCQTYWYISSLCRTLRFEIDSDDTKRCLEKSRKIGGKLFKFVVTYGIELQIGMMNRSGSRLKRKSERYKNDSRVFKFIGLEIQIVLPFWLRKTCENKHSVVWRKNTKKERHWKALKTFDTSICFCFWLELALYSIHCDVDIH